MVTLVGYLANWKVRRLRTLVVDTYTFHPLRPPLPMVDGTLYLLYSIVDASQIGTI